MKLKIIETPDYILAVSDGEIKEGDLCYDMDGDPGHNGCKFIVKCLRTAKDSYWNKHTKKIIAHQPKGNSSELDLPLLPEIVEDGVGKLAEHYVSSISYKAMKEAFAQGYLIAAFINGYRAATKVYSEKDLDKAIDWAIEKGRTVKVTSKDIDDFIQSLKQPKTPKWFVAETTGGGEYLAGEIGGNEIWAEYPIELKTTTINSKTYLLGTYLYE